MTASLGTTVKAKEKEKHRKKHQENEITAQSELPEDPFRDQTNISSSQNEVQKIKVKVRKDKDMGKSTESTHSERISDVDINELEVLQKKKKAKRRKHQNELKKDEDPRGESKCVASDSTGTKRKEKGLKGEADIIKLHEDPANYVNDSSAMTKYRHKRKRKHPDNETEVGELSLKGQCNSVSDNGVEINTWNKREKKSHKNLEKREGTIGDIVQEYADEEHTKKHKKKKRRKQEEEEAVPMEDVPHYSGEDNFPPRHDKEKKSSKKKRAKELVSSELMPPGDPCEGFMNDKRTNTKKREKKMLVEGTFATQDASQEGVVDDGQGDPVEETVRKHKKRRKQKEHEGEELLVEGASEVGGRSEIKPKKDKHQEKTAFRKGDGQIVSEQAEGLLVEGASVESERDRRSSLRIECHENNTGVENNDETSLVSNHRSQQISRQKRIEGKTKPSHSTGPNLLTFVAGGLLSEYKFRCAHCNAAFKSAVALQEHFCRRRPRWKQQNDERAQFPCLLCSKSYIQKQHLSHHVKVAHLGIRKYTCPECSKAFSVKQTLVVHMRGVHDRNQPFTCRLCEYKSITQSDVFKHCDVFHKVSRRFACTLCKLKYHFKDDLKKHFKNIHGQNLLKNDDWRVTQIPGQHEEILPFMCRLCGCPTEARRAVHKHYSSVHQLIRRFGCTICSKKYYFEEDLKDHRATKHGLSLLEEDDRVSSV